MTYRLCFARLFKANKVNGIGILYKISFFLWCNNFKETKKRVEDKSEHINLLYNLFICESFYNFFDANTFFNLDLFNYDVQAFMILNQDINQG